MSDHCPSHSQYVDHFQMQITEVEMIQSMYPNTGEFVMDGECVSVLADMTEYVNTVGTSAFPLARLEYAVNLQTDKYRFEVCCAFPHDYPAVEPEMYVRCPWLTRDQQHRLNADLTTLLATKIDRGELCVGPLLQWLQDHGASYVSVKADAAAPELPEEEEEGLHDFCRYWIYSHHIYNKVKRRAILELAKELDLTGFCLPGKPGIICAEGTARNCGDFWHRIKHMTWKKIMCKMKETEELVDNDVDKLRRFNFFEEVAFENKKAHGRDFHMDMGEFLKFLEVHNCGYVFKDYFGIDGRSAAH